MKIFHGDCLETLRKMDVESADSLVTDPPAGISFMGKEWDDDKGGRDQWIAWMTEVMKECLRVLKPGAHGLVWALPRTSHWTATALEDAGFEVRDVVTHLFGTGFPKSLDISKAIDKAAGSKREVLPDPQAARRNKAPRAMAPGETPRTAMAAVTAPATDAAKQWSGWGTALKPASEHWILVRKPLSEKTVAANVLKHGTGGINIDGCRIGSEVITSSGSTGMDARRYREGTRPSSYSQSQAPSTHAGRFPANIVLDEEAAAALDEQSGVTKSSNGSRPTKSHSWKNSSKEGITHNGFGDIGGASRFFYVAKASKSDKGEGNTHPTVKSTALMAYLIKLVTPPGGVVLDPFMGSGSTGVAAVSNGFRFVGIEREAQYFDFASDRIGLFRKTEEGVL